MLLLQCSERLEAVARDGAEFFERERLELHGGTEAPARRHRAFSVAVEEAHASVREEERLVFESACWPHPAKERRT